MKLKENISEDVLELFSDVAGVDKEDIYGIRVCCVPLLAYAQLHVGVDMPTPHSSEMSKDVTNWVTNCPNDMDSLNWYVIANGVSRSSRYLLMNNGHEPLPPSVIFAKSSADIFNEPVYSRTTGEFNPKRLNLHEIIRHRPIIEGFLIQIVMRHAAHEYVIGKVMHERTINRIMMELSPANTMFI